MCPVSQGVAAPQWASRWLWAAGVYNLLWGACVIVWPHALFDLAGAPRLNYPEIWQCVGMIVGVYGIGYLIAADDPWTHWPIVLVGLLGKVFGPIGFAFAMARGTLPPLLGLTILTNDLAWWIPFVLILRDAARHRRATVPPNAALRERFVKQSRFDVAPEVVFRFHESPDALQRLIPPWEPMRLVESAGSLRPGSRVVLRGRLGPFPIEWVAVHVEYDPPRSFTDRQEAGPFAYWYHSHRFLDDGQGGTLLIDEVDYVLPGGTIGRWLGGWFVRRKLEAMFAFRHETTRKWLETATASAS